MIHSAAGISDPASARHAAPSEPPTQGCKELNFDDFVQDHSRELKRRAYLLTGDYQLAEDLVQVTLEKLYRQWNRHPGVSHPRAYANTSLVRTFIGLRRRRWTTERPTSTFDEINSPDANDGFSLRDAVKAALAGLPPRQRAAIVLRYYCDMSEADTARVLNCTTGTVKSQTSKALARLRPLLAPELDEPQPM